ncbi:MAG: zinc ribbon domain-containing protein [Eubacterium sp.]|nr:zinc ribbon domain-containing protein [Eubacterium sp.]
MTKVCPYCGFLNDSSYKICTNCGNPLDPGTTNPATANQTGSSEYDSTLKPNSNNSFGQGNDKMMINPNSFNNNTGWMVNEKEQVRFSLKNGYMSNFISSEGFMNEDAIVTNKRLYYNNTEVNLMGTSRTEFKVDIEDITATTITKREPWLFLILAGISFLVGLAIPETAFIFSLLIPLFFVGMFFAARKVYLKVEYAGGSSGAGILNPSGVLYFSVKKYGIDAVRHFQNEIYKVKEEIKMKKLK